MGLKCHKEMKPPPPLPDKTESISSLPLPVVPEQPIEPLRDGITLLWLDANAGKSSAVDENSTLFYFRQLNVVSIRLYTDVKSCLDFIKAVPHDRNTHRSRIFLIVSGSLSLQILPELISFPIVEAVVIFCMDRSNYLHSMTEYKSLIIGICTENDDLYNCLFKKLEEFHQSTLIFHFFSQKQNTTRNLTTDSASFLWFQLFQKILSELKCTKNEMKLMLDYCSKQSQYDIKRKQYLFQIKQFSETYKSEDAVSWYTKESFVYRLLNTALRTEDIEGLYIFRFFIADLCRQLKCEHEKFRLKQIESPVLKLYRGGYISRDELDNLRGTIGNLISLNGFVSTSMEQWVALKFIEKQPTRQVNVEKVLFIIEVDTRSERIICGYVAELSAQKVEEEVLFNIGTVYHLNEIIYEPKQQIWHVHMKATEDGIKAAEDYMQLIHRELTDSSVSIIFGQLFLQMGNYIMAQKYFLDLLEYSTANDQDFPAICYHLALTHGYQGELAQAENRLNEVLQYHRSVDSKNLDFARTKNALGWIYHHSGELDQAMDYYEQALLFAETQLDSNHLINAQTCSLMGDCYLEKLKLDQAKECYERALDIERLHLPIDHPRIGVTLNDLGNVYRKQKQMKEAIDYYGQAETIFRRHLPNYHPCTAYCWSCMAFIYLYEEDTEKAQEYHKRALEIYRRVLPKDHLNIKISEINSQCTNFQKINDVYVKICAQV